MGIEPATSLIEKAAERGKVRAWGRKSESLGGLGRFERQNGWALADAGCLVIGLWGHGGLTSHMSREASGEAGLAGWGGVNKGEREGSRKEVRAGDRSYR